MSTLITRQNVQFIILYFIISSGRVRWFRCQRHAPTKRPFKNCFLDRSWWGLFYKVKYFKLFYRSLSLRSNRLELTRPACDGPLHSLHRPLTGHHLQSIPQSLPPPPPPRHCPQNSHFRNYQESWPVWNPPTLPWKYEHSNPIWRLWRWQGLYKGLQAEKKECHHWNVFLDDSQLDLQFSNDDSVDLHRSAKTFHRLHRCKFSVQDLTSYPGTNCYWRLSARCLRRIIPTTQPWFWWWSGLWPWFCALLWRCWDTFYIWRWAEMQCQWFFYD